GLNMVNAAPAQPAPAAGIVLSMIRRYLSGGFVMKMVRVALVVAVAAAGFSIAGCAKAPAPAPVVVKG
ncbi:hypothetical protein J8J40_30305, partial [Mycobacterium tuberculosis]|nr:hypothetical protein [Mycobacterium tuberculosis]MBP0651359.1 hypothetical protein [Mycobacterium tuberculosis]